MVRLQRIAMVTQNGTGIYAPLRLAPIKEVEEDIFLTDFVASAQLVPVSFAVDGISEPKPMMVYMNWRRWKDGYYIVIKKN